ncbi:MAG: cation transporter [Spirochaetaceae bacterium]|jgi:copper ion binding protein|nr:cation transporter [Spirochaetaceae bacterium]
MEKAVLGVEGMSCEHCVKAVAHAISSLESVKKVKVDLKGKTASFMYEPDKTPLAKIEAAVTEAGYTVVQ